MSIESSTLKSMLFQRRASGQLLTLGSLRKGRMDEFMLKASFQCTRSEPVSSQTKVFGIFILIFQLLKQTLSLVFMLCYRIRGTGELDSWIRGSNMDLDPDPPRIHPVVATASFLICMILSSLVLSDEKQPCATWQHFVLPQKGLCMDKNQCSTLER